MLARSFRYSCRVLVAIETNLSDLWAAFSALIILVRMNLVKEEFFEGRTPDLETERDRLKLIELHGDAFANYASTKFARMVAATSSAPVYEYRCACSPSTPILSLVMF